MFAPKRPRPKWLSTIFLVLQLLILLGILVSIPVSFFLREGNTPATLVVILALIAYIGYVGYTIWAGMR
ncbi:MAG: hypothetical protein ACM3N4_00290, partial [Nitrososphaerota archaeon]